MIRKEGSYIKVNMNAAVVNDVTGEYMRIICMINQMTEQGRVTGFFHAGRSYVVCLLSSDRLALSQTQPEPWQNVPKF